MRILVVNFEYPPVGGGASPVSEEIATYLKQLDHSIDVITMAYGDLPLVESRNGITIYRIESGRKLPNMSRFSEHLKFLYNSRKFLIGHLSDHSYDVVHCHFFISSGILARWIWQQYSIPYIITPHGSDLPGYNPDHFKLMHLFTPPLIRKMVSAARYVVAPSEYLSNLVRPFIKDGDDKLVVVPNGIYIPSADITEKKKIILTTGRLLKRKGFHTLIEAVKDEDLGYELHIAGDGPMMEHLKSLASRSKTRVVFHGWLDNKSHTYHQLLREASIYCLVSTFENAPISILEAMAHKCAVITSDGTGCAEMVGDSGITLPPDNSQKLSEELKDLIKKPGRLKELGEKAYLRIESRYTWSSIAESYDELLKRACRK